MFITALFIITKKLETIQMSFNCKRQTMDYHSESKRSWHSNRDQPQMLYGVEPHVRHTQQEGNHVWYWKPS